MTDSFFYSIAIILISMGLCLVLTKRVRMFLLKRNLLDIPNERSSHTIPVPRGGGWAVVIVLIPGLVFAGLHGQSLLAHAGLIAGCVLLVAISWLDDRRGVSPALRLTLHITAALVGSFVFSSHEIIFGGALPLWLDRVLMILGWAWFINLYNFMDGIDGITGVETIALATGACLVMTATGINDPFTSTLTLLLTGTALGFLALNWHPAKIFLGDIGSVPLGYLTGFALITLAMHGHFISALILPLYYLADSGITMGRRALKGEKIWQAHRQHFYQRAAAGLKRHDKVVYAVIAANIVLMAAALLAVTHGLAGLCMAVVTVAILLGWMHKSSIT